MCYCIYLFINMYGRLFLNSCLIHNQPHKSQIFHHWGWKRDSWENVRECFVIWMNAVKWYTHKMSNMISIITTPFFRKKAGQDRKQLLCLNRNFLNAFYIHTEYLPLFLCSFLNLNVLLRHLFCCNKNIGKMESKYFLNDS